MRHISPVWILFAILVLSAALRLVFLQSIPPYQVDEGSWNIGARDKLVEGDWCFTIRKFCVSPVHEVLAYLWFLIWSPGLYAARILSVLLDVTSVLLMYLIGRKLFSDRTGLIASFLFASNSLVILTGRKAMLESDATFWILLTFLLFIDRRTWSRILAGIAMALVIGTKLYAFKMVVVFAIYEVMLFWDDRGWRPFRALLGRPFLVFLAMSVVGTALIFGTVFHYYPMEFTTERASYAAPISLMPKWFGTDSLTYSIKYYVIRDGLTILLAFLAFVFLITHWRRIPSEVLRRENRNAVFFIHWTWILVLGTAVMHYQPPRYYTLMMPAYILLAALFIDRQLFPTGHPALDLGTRASGSTPRKNLLGWATLALFLAFTVASYWYFYFDRARRDTSAPEALAWVNQHIPAAASIGADYYMAVSLPYHKIYPLHPQRYYSLSPGKDLGVDDYFVDPFGLPNYYTVPVPGHFRHRRQESPDYVLLPVNHGDTGGEVRFKRFMRSPRFTDNYSILKEFVDSNHFRTILFVRKSLTSTDR